MPRAETTTPRRNLWRALTAAPLPLLVVLYALWAELVTLDGTGFHAGRDLDGLSGWLMMSFGTTALVVALWARSRPLRMVSMALYSLVLAFGFGASGVIAIVHAFGGPRGDLTAPGWVIVALSSVSILCGLAVLSLGALIVDDIRAGDAGDG